MSVKLVSITLKLEKITQDAEDMVAESRRRRQLKGGMNAKKVISNFVLPYNQRLQWTRFAAVELFMLYSVAKHIRMCDV